MKQKGTILFTILFTSVMVFAVIVAARTSVIYNSAPTPATAAVYPVRNQQSGMMLNRATEFPYCCQFAQGNVNI